MFTFEALPLIENLLLNLTLFCLLPSAWTEAVCAPVPEEAEVAASKQTGLFGDQLRPQTCRARACLWWLPTNRSVFGMCLIYVVRYLFSGFLKK